MLQKEEDGKFPSSFYVKYGALYGISFDDRKRN